MKKYLLIFAGIAAFFAGAVTAGAGDSGGPGNSQLFFPARYVVSCAEINVRMRNQQNRKTQNVLVRLDTQTGEVMILQLSVVSDNDPTVLAAVWVPVTSAAVGNWNENSGQGI